MRRQLPAATLQQSHVAAMLAMACAELQIKGEIKMVKQGEQVFPAILAGDKWISHSQDLEETRGRFSQAAKQRRNGNAEESLEQMPWLPELLYWHTGIGGGGHREIRNHRFRTMNGLIKAAESSDTDIEFSHQVALPRAIEAAGKLLEASARIEWRHAALRIAAAALAIGTAITAIMIDFSGRGGSWPVPAIGAFIAFIGSIILAANITGPKVAVERKLAQADTLARLLEPQVLEATKELEEQGQLQKRGRGRKAQGVEE